MHTHAHSIYTQGEREREGEGEGGEERGEEREQASIKLHMYTEQSYMLSYIACNYMQSTLTSIIFHTISDQLLISVAL